MKDFLNLFNGHFEEFKKQYLDKQVYKFSISNIANFCIGLKEVEKIISNNVLYDSNLDVVSSGSRIDKRSLKSHKNVLNKGVILQLLKNGETIAIEKVNLLNDKLNCLSRQLENYTFLDVGMNMYISPSFSSSGFPPHYDTHDIFVFQIFGKKRWRIYDSPEYLPNADNPFKSSEHKNYFAETPSLEFDLEEGDVLYIPRGWVHNTFTQEKESVHLTLGLHRTLTPKLPTENTHYYIGGNKIDIKAQSQLFNTIHEVENLWSKPNSINAIFTGRISDPQINISSKLIVDNEIRFKISFFENYFVIETPSHKIEFPSLILNVIEIILAKKKLALSEISTKLHDQTLISIATKLFRVGIINVKDITIPNNHLQKQIDLNRQFYFPINGNNIINPTSELLIQPLFKSKISTIIELIERKYSSQIVSAYLRGSVAIGIADKDSDIDMVFIVKSLNNISNIMDTFLNAIPEINLAIYNEKATLRSKSIIFTLKTQGLLIYGKDYIKDFPLQEIHLKNLFFFKGYSKAKSFFANRLMEETEQEKKLSLVSSNMKYLLRAAFETVMIPEMKFTREIVSCYKCVIKHYPENSVFFYQILYLAVNPTADKDVIFRTIEKFDSWILKIKKNNGRTDSSPS